MSNTDKKKEKKKLNKILKKKKDVNLPKKILAAAIMMKNESARITVTLESIKGICDKVIIYDTGSKDESVNIVKKWCDENKIQLHLLEGEFEDFSKSRNKLLEFCDDKADYLLLLDSNEELKEGQNLRKYVDTYDGQQIGWHSRQVWSTASSVDQYYNIKFIKTRHGFRYHQSVHEYIMSQEAVDNPELLDRATFFFLFQDRRYDDDKSKHRFIRDREMLYKEHLEKPDDARVLFYLGQTVMCMGQYHLAYRYYNQRTKINVFPEEIYHSYYHMARISQVLGHDWSESLILYLKAFEYTKRVEPLLRIAEYYTKLGELNEQKVKEQYTEQLTKTNGKITGVNYVGCSYYDVALNYLRTSLELDYPEKCILFVNRQTYDYERWFLFSNVILKENAFIIFVNDNRLDKNGSVFTNLLKRYKEGLDAVKLCLSVGEKSPMYTNEEKIKICKENLKTYNEMIEKFKQ